MSFIDIKIGTYTVQWDGLAAHSIRTTCIAEEPVPEYNKRREKICPLL
jgi:hypothetical protein